MAEQLYPFREGSLWGYRNEKGQTAIPARFDSAGSFSEGLARVRVSGKWGFVNTLGEMTIQPQFDQARFFQGGYAKVQQGSQWGYVDVKGFFVEKLDAGTFLNKSGEFISEEEYRKWGKAPGEKE
jgi:hypothetical protein